MVVVNCFTRKASVIWHLNGLYLCRLNHCNICLFKKGHTVLVISFLLERGADTVDRCQHTRDSLGSPLQGFVELFKLSRSECKTQDCPFLKCSAKPLALDADLDVLPGSHFIQAAENSVILSKRSLNGCVPDSPPGWAQQFQGCHWLKLVVCCCCDVCKHALWISLTDQRAHLAGGPKKVSPGSVGRLSRQPV